MPEIQDNFAPHLVEGCVTKVFAFKQQTSIDLGHYILENALEIGGITNLKSTRIEHEGAHTFSFSFLFFWGGGVGPSKNILESHQGSTTHVQKSTKYAETRVAEV